MQALINGTYHFLERRLLNQQMQKFLFKLMHVNIMAKDIQTENRILTMAVVIVEFTATAQATTLSEKIAK